MTIEGADVVVSEGDNLDETSPTDEAERIALVAKEKADREVLEVEVEKGLAAIFGDEVENPDDSVNEDKPKDEPKDEPKDDEVKEDEVKDESKDDEVVASDEPKADEGETPSEPTLPAAWRRSAKAREWTDEEIDVFVKANTEVAMKTFERIHTSRAEEIARFAELGRKAKEQSPKAPLSEKAAEAVVDILPKGLQPIDVDAVTEKFGNEELVRELAGPINQAIEQIQKLGPLVQQGAKAIEQSHRETLERQITDFFAGEELKPYAKVYGDAKADGGIVKEQQQNRWKVLEIADAIVAGATMQGRSMGVNEALLMAHDSVASEFKEQVIRSDIKTKVKQRADTISVKPSSHKTTPTDGKPRTRQELVRQVEEKMSGVFT